MSIKLIVRFSDLMVEPAYLPAPPTQGGTWIMSIDGHSYATASGSPMGITGEWTVVSMTGTEYNRAMIREVYTSLVGKALMDGKALWIHGSTPSTVSFSMFGVLKGITPVKTIAYTNNQWSFLREVVETKPEAPQVQLSWLGEVPDHA